MLTCRFYRPGYVISQRTEAVNGEALRWMCNPRRYQGILDIQVIEELFFGKGIQLLNVFVERQAEGNRVGLCRLGTTRQGPTQEAGYSSLISKMMSWSCAHVATRFRKS